MSAYGQIVIIKRTGEDGSCFPVLSKACKVGRGNVCDIRVQRDGVSDEQCIIEIRIDAEAWIRNLTHSQTLLNGIPISNKGSALKHKDIFVVSDRAFRWEYMPGSKFCSVTKEDSTQSVKALIEINRKDDKDKVQTEASEQVRSPALQTPRSKSTRKSIIETVTNIRGWSVFDMSDRSDNVLQSPINPGNNSPHDLIDFDESVRSYLEGEILSSAEKQRGSVNSQRRSLRKSNERRQSTTSKLVNSSKKLDESLSKKLENKKVLVSEKLVSSDAGSRITRLSSLEKGNLEVSDLTEDGCEPLNASDVSVRDSGFLIEDNLQSFVTVGKTRGRRFFKDGSPFVTPALLNRPFIKTKQRSSDSVGHVVDSRNGNQLESVSSMSLDSRSAAADESSLVNSFLSDSTGCGDESMNENQSLITSEEENDESMPRNFVNIRQPRRYKNKSISSSPFVTPAILKSMKRNTRRSSNVSGVSLEALKLPLNSLGEVEHDIASPKSQRRVRRSTTEFSRGSFQTSNEEVGNNKKCTDQKELDAADQMRGETLIEDPDRSSQEERSEIDHPIIVQSPLQVQGQSPPTSLRSKRFHMKTPDKKFMRKEEHLSLEKCSTKTKHYEANSLDEFSLHLSNSESADEASEEVYSTYALSFANTTNGTIQSVASESFVTSSSSKKPDSADGCSIESREIIPNTSFDESVEYFRTSAKKIKSRESKSGIGPQGTVSVNESEIVENDKENLNELPLGQSSEESLDSSTVKSTESNLLDSSTSTRRSLRKSFPNAPSKKVTDSVLEDVNPMTPVNVSVKDESVKSKRKTRKSVIEQENVPIVTNEKEEYGKGLEKSIEGDGKDLSISNLSEASFTSAVKSTKNTPRARKSLADLSLIETNTVKSNRKSSRCRKSRGLDGSSAQDQNVFSLTQEGGVSLSRNPIANNKEQISEIKSSKSLRKTRHSEMAPMGSISVIGNSAGIVKVMDSLDSIGIANEESSLMFNLSASSKSIRRTPGKIKLAGRISDLATHTSQEEIDSCFEGLMGDLLKTPVTKIANVGGKSSKKKRSGMKSKNVSFNFDNTSVSIRDDIGSSIIEDECEESFIKPLDSCLKSVGKLRSSGKKCRGLHTFSSTPISNASKKLNLSKNPASDAVHSPITEEETPDITVSHKTRSINFDILEESSASMSETSESKKNISAEVEEGTSSKSLLSALSSVKSNKTTPRSRRSAISDSLLASSSLGFSFNPSVSDSSCYEDAVSDIVKISSAATDKVGRKTGKVSSEVMPAEDLTINEENVTENSKEISLLLEEDANTTVEKPKQLDGSSLTKSGKRNLRNRLSGSCESTLTPNNQTYDLRSTEDNEQYLIRTPTIIEAEQTSAKEKPRSNKKKRNSRIELRMDELSATKSFVEDRGEEVEQTGIAQKIKSNDSLINHDSGTSNLVKSSKKISKLRKVEKEQMDDSNCLDGISNLMQTPAVKSRKSKSRRSEMESIMDVSGNEEELTELQGEAELNGESVQRTPITSPSTGVICTKKSVKKTPKQKNGKKVLMNDTIGLDGISYLMQTPADKSRESIQKTKRSEMERKMEDFGTEEILGELYDEAETADEVTQESLISSPSTSAISSVKSVMKTPKQRTIEKGQMNNSSCLDGVSNLMQTPADILETSTRRTRRLGLERTMEDLGTEEIIKELKSNNGYDPSFTDVGQESLVSSPSADAPSSVKSLKKTPMLKIIGKEQMNDSSCLDGVSELMQTPAVKSAKSLRQSKQSRVMEDSGQLNLGESIAEMSVNIDDCHNYVEDTYNESLITHPPLSAQSSVKSVKETPKWRKNDREHMNVSDCLDGVSSLMQTPAVKSRKSLRKSGIFEMESVLDDLETKESIEELHGESNVADQEVQESLICSPSTDAPSSAKSVKKTLVVKITKLEQMNDSICLDGVSNLMQTPAVESRKSLRKTRRSEMESIKDVSGDELQGTDAEFTGELDQRSPASSPTTAAPTSVKSLKKTPKQRVFKKEIMNDSNCLDGVSDLRQTPVVKSARSYSKATKTEMESAMEDLVSEESLVELRGIRETDVDTNEKEVQDYSIYSPSSWAPCSVKSVKKTPKLRKIDQVQMHESFALDCSYLMPTPSLNLTQSLRKNRKSIVEFKGDTSRCEDSIAELRDNMEADAYTAEKEDSTINISSSSVLSLGKSSKKLAKHRKLEDGQMNVSRCLDEVSSGLETSAYKERKSLHRTRRSGMEWKVEELATERSIQDVNSGDDNNLSVVEEMLKDSPQVHPPLSAPRSVKLIEKTPKHKKTRMEQMNDSNCLDGISSLMKTPAVKSTPQQTPKQRTIEKGQMNNSSCLDGVSNLMQTPADILETSTRRTRRLGLERTMEDLGTEKIIEELKGNNGYDPSFTDVGQESPVSSPSADAPSSVKSLKKTPMLKIIGKEQMNDSSCLDGVSELMQTPAVKSAKSLRKSLRSRMLVESGHLNVGESIAERSFTIEDGLNSANEEICEKSIVTHSPLSARSSVISVKQTPKQPNIEKEQMNDSGSLDGVSNLLQTPALKSRKSLPKTRRSELESKMEEITTEGSISEVKSGDECDSNLLEEINNESLVVHPPLSAPSSVKSILKTPKNKKGRSKQIDDSDFLSGISNLIQTPGGQSDEMSRKMNDSFSVDDISKGCIGDADQSYLSHTEDVGMSLIKSPSSTMLSPQNSREKNNKNIGSSGILPFSSTPLIKPSNTGLSVSSNFENILRVNSRGSDMISPRKCRSSEGNARNIGSSLMVSSGMGKTASEIKRRARKSNESSLVSDLTPTSLGESRKVNVSEIKNGDETKEDLAMENDGRDVRKSSLSGKSTRRSRSRLVDSSLLSDNEEAGDENSFAVDGSWLTSSTFSFVRTPESSKIQSSEKITDSENVISMDEKETRLINDVEETRSEVQENSVPENVGESSQGSGYKIRQSVSSYEDVRGVKEVMTRRSPLSRYSGFLGVKEMFISKSPFSSYENVSGVKELFRRRSPESRYSGVQGLRELFDVKIPVCKYENVSDVGDLFNASSASKDNQRAAGNTASQLSDRSKRKRTHCITDKKAKTTPVVLLQRLDSKLIDQALEKENLEVKNMKSKRVSGRSDEKGAEGNQENPVVHSGDEKLMNLPISSASHTVSEETEPMPETTQLSTAISSTVDENSKSGETKRKDRLPEKKSEKEDLNHKRTVGSSNTGRRALRGNKSISNTVSEEIEPSLKTTQLSAPISNTVDDNSKSGETKRRGRPQKSKPEEKDVNHEETVDSSSIGKRALRGNRSTSVPIEVNAKKTRAGKKAEVSALDNCDEALKLKPMKIKSVTFEMDAVDAVDKKDEDSGLVSGDKLCKLLQTRSKSHTASEESVPLPKRTTSESNNIVEESKSSQTKAGRPPKSKSKEKTNNPEELEDASSTGRRALRGNKSTSLSEENEPLRKRTKLAPSISESIGEESNASQANVKSREQKAKSKDVNIKATEDSSTTARRALRGNKSTSVPIEVNAKKTRAGKKAEVSALDNCDEALKLKPMKVKSITFEMDAVDAVDKKEEDSGLVSGDKLRKLPLKRSKSHTASEESVPLPKRTTSESNNIVEESKPSQTKAGRPPKSKSKEKTNNPEELEDASSTGRRALRGNKSTSLSEKNEPLRKRTKLAPSISESIGEESNASQANVKSREQKAKSKEVNIKATEDSSTTARRALRGNKSTSLSEENELLSKRTKLAPSISESISEESNASQANENSREQKAKSKDVNIKTTEDSSTTARRALRGNKSTSVTVETEAKKIVGKKADVSILDVGDKLAKLQSKRTISHLEENEPLRKRTKRAPSISESIGEESNASQANEKSREQKAKSKDVNIKATEDSSTTARRALRGNKSTSSAAVSEEILKKNKSKRGKCTASPAVAPSVKENGETTDARLAGTEDSGSSQTQKSKPNKKDLKEEKGKRVTRKTSVDTEVGDSEKKSNREEIPTKGKKKVEVVVARVTRGQKKAVEIVNKKKR